MKLCKRSSLLLLILSVYFTGSVCAQNKKFPLITGDFKNVSVEQFLLQLQEQSGYTFYYDTAKLDTVKLDILVNKVLLPDVLELAFKNKGTGYAIDDQQHVFITKGIVVQTELPANFFDGNKAKRKDTTLKNNNLDYYGELTKPLDEKTTDSSYNVGDASAITSGNNIIINGYVRDAKTGEPVIGATVFTEKPRITVLTDQYGYYSITLPKGRYILNVQSINMRDLKRQIYVHSEGKLNIDMTPQVMTLKRVIVSTEKAGNIKSQVMGLQKIDIAAIKQVPVVFGEADVLRVVMTMPGVKTVGEASTGLNVRGGSADQNLILFNESTIYNPSHFFGMFSAFNPEVVKDVELYKSSVPAKYGGRLSSVLEVNSREGNKKNVTGSAGIGLLTSRFNIEGPIMKDKSSFLIGARTTYANWLLKLLPDQYKDSKAGFYDLNINLNQELNKKNTIYLTGYYSRDRFNLNNDTSYRYESRNVSLKWKHIFNSSLYMLVSGGYDAYKYQIQSDKNPINAYSLGFDINQYYYRMHFNYYINPKYTVEFGLNSLYYKLHPGEYSPVGQKSLVTHDVLEPEQALESALYASLKYNVTSDLSLEGGMRYSMFNLLGPNTINNYPQGIPRTESNIVDSSYYGKNKIIKTYSGPEVRLSARYALSPTFSIKGGYNSLRQYIHVLSNTAAMAPTDIWKLSDPNIKPQYGDQYSIGLYKNFKSNTIETSLEVYYKNIKDYLDYKSGAVLVMNHHIETDVLNTKGRAYGIELLIKKTQGKLNGWLSYTYSRIELKADDISAGEIINGGKYYPANYDKPHDVTAIGNYKINHRLSISLNATYSTGRPITLPIGRFYYEGSYRTLYADRNAYRIPDYFRTDFSMNIDGNHKIHQKTHNSFTIGVYNLTGRKNPYSVYYVSEGGVINGYKLSIFGSAIPFINYNIRF